MKHRNSSIVTREEEAAVEKKTQIDILAERRAEIKRAKQSITPQDLVNAINKRYSQDLG